MDFARSGDTALQSSTSPEQETKLFVTGGGGGGAPFMASNYNNNIMQHPSQHQQNDDHRYHHHHAHDQMSYGMMMQTNTSSSSALDPTTNFISTKDGTGTGAYDLGELDQALFLYLDAQDHPSSSVQDQRQNNSGLRPPTLNIFPSKPMHVGDSSSAKAMSTMGLVSPAASSGSKRSSEPSMDLLSNANTTSTTDVPPSAGPPPVKAVKREGNGSVRKGLTSSSEHNEPKTPDPKTLRRLAQNREAARKSRLRKKAYVQQLETSRMKLTQLEQDLQRARAQGVSFVGGGGLIGAEQGLPLGMGNLSSGAAMFDMEYGRWLEEHHRMMCELRAVLQEQLPENELRLFVDNCLAHLDEMMNLKSMIAKTDVFYLVSGAWKTPAERCFMWMGGFRPSHIIKILLNQIEPLTEQQLLGVCQLQQSSQEAEDALSQGLEALNQSLLDIIVSDSLSCPPNITNYMGQMAMAMNKLSTVEGFVRQADNLRHQTIHRLHQLLTTRQSARCLIGIAEYFHRLRALSSLWMARPRQD